MGVGGQRHAPAALPPVKTRYQLYSRRGKAPGPVWTGAGNLAPTVIRVPDRPPRSESLSRPSYPGPRNKRSEFTVIFVVDVVLNRLTDTAMCAETHNGVN
jgi:hypothetical protein